MHKRCCSGRGRFAIISVMDRKFENITILLALAIIVLLFLLAYVFTPKKTEPVSAVEVQSLDGNVPAPLAGLVAGKISNASIIESQLRKLSDNREQAVLVYAAYEPLNQTYLYFKSYFKAAKAELTKDAIKDDKFALNALEGGMRSYNIFGEKQGDGANETTLVNISLVTVK